MNFAKQTMSELLTLEAENFNNLYWYIDAAFSDHPNMKSHTGAVFSMGKGNTTFDSTKQIVNARSFIKAKMNGVHDKSARLCRQKSS